MASRRMVASDIFEDDFFMGIDTFARLLWIGLVVRCADDQGRLQDNAILIKSQIFPADNIDPAIIDKLIETFHQSGKAHRYTAEGKRLIQIVNWWKYQTPVWANKSKYPAPTNWVDREKHHAQGNKIVTVNWDKPGGFTNIVTNPHTNPHSKPLNEGEVKGEDDGNCKDDEETPAPAPTFRDEPQLERLYTMVTQNIALPGSDRDKSLEALEKIARGKTDNEVYEYLSPFWQSWKGRKYSRSNCGWLIDWAVTGEVPEKREPNGSAKQLTHDEVFARLRAKAAAEEAAENGVTQ